MKVLLDTLCWLWWLSTPERLGEEAQRCIEDPANKVFLSAASSWEIAFKYTLGKLPLPEHPTTFVPTRLRRDDIHSLPIQHAHALHVASLPQHHREPFDRLLVAQAQLERMLLVTADSQLQFYDVDMLFVE